MKERVKDVAYLVAWVLSILLALVIVIGLIWLASANHLTGCQFGASC